MTEAFAYTVCVVVFFLLSVAVNLRGKHDADSQH